MHTINKVTRYVPKMVPNVYTKGSEAVLQVLLVHTIQGITCYGVEIVVSVYTGDRREA